MILDSELPTVKSATVEKILEVSSHPNADRMSLAKVKGWTVCIKKDEYKAGDLCIYVQTDSILSECPRYEFLRNKDFRIRPMKLRGVLSQGIIFPISMLKDFGVDTLIVDENVVGTDVSNHIKASHYERPIPTCLAGKIKGHLPSFLKKTDEENIENVVDIINELTGKPYYITIKVDGSSGSFYIKDGVFGVCSRNLDLKEDEVNGFWQIAKKYDIENKLRTYFPNKNICVQGEVYGPGIQGNKLSATELSVSLFNLWDIDTHTYLGCDCLTDFCDFSKIPMVKIIESGWSFDMSLEKLQKLSDEAVYENGMEVEGIVLRPKISFVSTTMEKPLSVKIMNEKFKLKHG